MIQHETGSNLQAASKIVLQYHRVLSAYHIAGVGSREHTVTLHRAAVGREVFLRGFAPQLEASHLPPPSSKLAVVYTHVNWLQFSNKRITRYIIVLMTGLEALTALGLASNIIQFVDFSTKLCARIKEIYASSSGLPKELENQAGQLSSLLGTLKELSQQPRSSTLTYEVWERCNSEAQEISSLLKRFDVGSSKGLVKTTKMAYQSMRGNPEIEKVRDAFPMTLLRIMSLE